MLAPLAWDLSAGSYLTTGRSRVPRTRSAVYLAVVLAGLPGSRNAGIVLSPAGALNFSDAQIKRPAHVG